jgi:hypothetical protein
MVLERNKRQNTTVCERNIVLLTLRQVVHIATTVLNIVVCAIDVSLFCFPLMYGSGIQTVFRGTLGFYGRLRDCEHISCIMKVPDIILVIFNCTFYFPPSPYAWSAVGFIFDVNHQHENCVYQEFPLVFSFCK